MNARPAVRCAIYTRKSTEEGLDQEFNSLDAQHEACVAYVASQRHEGWKLVTDRYDDGGVSGATLERPAVQHLLADIDAGRVNRVVVYKIDRLTRSLGGDIIIEGDDIYGDGQSDQRRSLNHNQGLFGQALRSARHSRSFNVARLGNGWPWFCARSSRFCRGSAVSSTTKRPCRMAGRAFAPHFPDRGWSENPLRRRGYRCC